MSTMFGCVGMSDLKGLFSKEGLVGVAGGTMLVVVTLVFATVVLPFAAVQDAFASLKKNL